MEKAHQLAGSSLTAADVGVKLFLESGRLEREKNPLQWWKQQGHAFPRLSILSRSLLCIPATSVPSERVFSKAGELVSARRANLSKKNVDMLIFLNKLHH